MVLVLAHSLYSNNIMLLTILNVSLCSHTDSGRVLSCGSNAFGQLGIGPKPPFTAEVQVVEVIFLLFFLFFCST